MLDFFPSRLRRAILSQIITSEGTFYYQRSIIYRDFNLSNWLAILKLSLQAYHAIIEQNSGVLGLFHGSLWLSINECCLLALKLRARSLRILAFLRLVVFKCPLVKVTVSEVETSFDHVVFEHESIVVWPIFVVLFGFTSLCALELSAFKTIVKVVGHCSASDSLHFLRHLFSIFTEGFALCNFEFFDNF